MKQKPIDSRSFRYLALKFYVNLSKKLIFYRKFQVKFADRIPRDNPVIFAPNHQNAVNDALAVLISGKRNTVFLARADVFKNPMVARILRFLKILPIYRIRDGIGELSKNEEVFQTTLDVLDRKNSPICIMPEGNHGDKRRLRPLVKGIFRIAFRAQEKYGDNPGVQIVPVGLDYSNYSNFRSKILIVFGKPVQVSEYFPVYTENQAKGINNLRESLAEEMRLYMIDIKSQDYYNAFFNLREIYNDPMRKHMGIKQKDLYSRFVADKKMIGTLDEVMENKPDTINALSEKVTGFIDGINELKMRVWVFRKPIYSWIALLFYSLVMILFFPVFLYGLINNYLPYMIPAWQVKKVKDPQFHSSIKFVLGIVVFPLFYLIQFIIVAIIVPIGWIKWAYLVSLPILGLLAHEYYLYAKKLTSLWKYNFLTLRKNKNILDLKQLRAEIIKMMDALIKRNT